MASALRRPPKTADHPAPRFTECPDPMIIAEQSRPQALLHGDDHVFGPRAGQEIWAGAPAEGI